MADEVTLGKARPTAFEADDYRTFMRELAASLAPDGRGIQNALAHVIKCQPSYLTKIMKGTADLSIEQAISAAKFFNLDVLETRYFMTLVLLERAGSTELATHLKEMLEALKKDQNRIKERVSGHKAIPLVTASVYYSNWIYSAIHMVVSLPSVKTAVDIAKTLNLHPDFVRKGCDFLLQNGLIDETNGIFHVQKNFTYLGDDSPLLTLHHSNWRNKAMMNLQSSAQQDDLHYTAVFTISQKDVKEFRERLVALISELTVCVDASEEEKLQCLCLDWFSLK